MLPIPARTAIYAFCGSALMVLCGAAANSAITTVVGGGAMLGLAAALGLTIPIGTQLRRQRIELAWWLAHESGSAASLVAGVPFELRCSLRNRGTRGVRFTELLPVVPRGVRVIEGLDGELFLPPRSRTELRLRLSAAAPGRVVVQGLGVAVPGPLGLFAAPLYFPSPLTVKVLPRASSVATTTTRLGAGEAVERVGLTPLRRRGSGTELHEIREHRPGDAFKSIAWKASARAGKLLVREVEREVQDTLQLVLDVSGSMRGGEPGERLLDGCLELAALLARDALERGDRVGLITVDGRIVSEVAPAEGVRHMLRIYDALLHATEIVDADLTHSDDDAVAEQVGFYLRQQEGLDFSSSEGGFDLPALAAYAQRALQREPEHEQVVASTKEHALLRRFCRARGLAIPYRAETRGFAKGSGLSHALRVAAGSGRTPRTLLLLTDLDGVPDLEPMRDTLRMLRSRKHQVGFVIPDPAGFMPPPAGELERELRHVYSMQHARRMREARGELGRLGVKVLPYDARRGSAALLQGAAGLRSVA